MGQSAERFNEAAAMFAADERRVAGVNVVTYELQ